MITDTCGIRSGAAACLGQVQMHAILQHGFQRHEQHSCDRLTLARQSMHLHAWLVIPPDRQVLLRDRDGLNRLRTAT